MDDDIIESTSEVKRLSGIESMIVIDLVSTFNKFTLSSLKSYILSSVSDSFCTKSIELILNEYGDLELGNCPRCIDLSMIKSVVFDLMANDILELAKLKEIDAVVEETSSTIGLITIEINFIP